MRTVTRSSGGFTLIEVMITVVVVAILAAVALPSYLQYLERARRADAKAVLLEAAQFMERIYTERGAYNKKADGTTGKSLSDIGFPTPLTKSPKDGDTQYYAIQPLGDDFSKNVTETAFQLQAEPKGAQASSACGTLTLAGTGEKGQASGKTVDDCWNR